MQTRLTLASPLSLCVCALCEDLCDNRLSENLIAYFMDGFLKDCPGLGLDSARSHIKQNLCNF